MLVQERVGVGHPDKICDIIAEAVKGWFIKQDFDARTAIEVCAYPVEVNSVIFSNVIIFGEFSTSNNIMMSKDVILTIEKHIRQSMINVLGKEYCEYLNFRFSIELSPQSGEILAKSMLGSGDQGIIVGHYKKDVEDLFTKTEIIKNQLDNLDSIGKDWKLLVDCSTKKVIVNFHFPKYLEKNLTSSKATNIVENIVKGVFPLFQIIISSYSKGSIPSDSGLTGRKIFCDFPFSYSWGGGAVWGKDATKVDNSALLYLREFCREYAIKHSIKDLQITVVYNIAKNEPVSVEMLVENEIKDSSKIGHYFNVSNIVKETKKRYPKLPKIKF